MPGLPGWGAKTCAKVIRSFKKKRVPRRRAPPRPATHRPDPAPIAQGGEVQQVANKRSIGREVAARRKAKNKGRGERKTGNDGRTSGPTFTMTSSADQAGGGKGGGNGNGGKGGWARASHAATWWCNT